MNKIFNYRNKISLYRDLQKSILSLLKENRKDFIVVLPSQGLINKIEEDISNRINVILGLKIFTFDDLVKMNYSLEEDDNRKYYSKLLFEKSLQDLIENKTILDNTFFKSEGFTDISNKLNELINDSNLTVDVLIENFNDWKSFEAVSSLIKNYNEYTAEYKFLDKFKITRRFIEEFSNIENINKIIIAGFTKFTPLEIEILKKIQNENIEIELFYLNSYGENIVTNEVFSKLDKINFEIINKERFLKDWNFSTKVTKCEDKILEIKRLAIEVKRDLLENPFMKSCIITRNNKDIEEIQRVFNESDICLGIKEDVYLIDSELGIKLWNLLSLDKEIYEYLIINYKNPIIFNDVQEDTNFEKLLLDNAFTKIEDLFNSRVFNEIENSTILYDKVKVLENSFLSIQNNEELINSILKVLKEYIDKKEIREEDIEYRFFDFLKNLKERFIGVYKTLDFEHFVNYLKYLLKNYKTRFKSSVGFHVELTSFDIFNLQSYDNLYLIGFDDSNYPKKRTTDFYFNDKLISKYKTIGIDIMNNKELYYFELLDFFNIFDEELKKVYLSYSTEEVNLVSPFLKELNREYDNSFYGIKNYIKPSPREIITDEDRNRYLSEYKKHSNSKEDSQIKCNFSLIKKNSKGYSVSKLETYISCPIKYFYKYVLDLKDYFVPKYENLIIGTSVHETLKQLYDNYKIFINPKLNKTSFINKVFVDKLEKNDYIISSLDLDKINRYVNLISKTIKMDVDFLEKNSLVPIGFEEKFIKEFNVDGKLIRFEGIIDRIDQDHNGNIHLVDYKIGSSGIKKYSDFIKKGESLQFPIYGLAKNAVSCRYIQIANSQYQYFYNYTDLDLMEQYMNNMSSKVVEIVSKTISDIENEKFFEGALNKTNCRFCEYKDFCKYKV